MAAEPPPAVWDSACDVYVHDGSDALRAALRLGHQASREPTPRRWLTSRDLLRARFRCLEEVESVRYSLKDLAHARKLGWLTAAGWELVTALKRELDKVEKRIAPYESMMLKSRYGRELKRHQKELMAVRETYGPVRLLEA